MAEKYQHKIAADLRAYAQKIAAEKSAAGEGAPDRMTTGDGDGGITVSKGSIPSDVGEKEVKTDQPADGKTRTAASLGGSPDRMTTGDGDGGIDVSKGSIPTDVGEGEVKADLPADGMVRKAATLSVRAQGIRSALLKTSPTLAAKIEAQEKKAAGTPAPGQKQAAAPAPQQAATPSLNLSQETLAKIASAVLSTDEGVRFVHDALEKQAGEAAAHAQIKDAIAAAQVYDEGEQIKSAAFNDLGRKAQAIHASLMEHGVTEDDCDQVIKQASFMQTKIASFEHPMLKAAYVQGMDDAALMAAADDAGGEGGAPPVEEALPMGGEELGEEEIMQLLEEMLASGEITEEDIAAALAATEGGGVAGGGEEAATAGAEGDPAAAEAAAAEAAIVGEEGAPPAM